jgi:hypothetical protein
MDEMNKEQKFHERILANLNAELLYCLNKGDKERQEYLELQIKKQKELIERMK